jgi:tRNA(Ile)-lysidine synthetase-like protein
MQFIHELNDNFIWFQQIFEKLKKYIFHDTKILIAVSGWPDSMFVSSLLYIFYKKNNFDINNLFFCHCNHKTRPETDEEEKFIRKFFEWLNMNIYTYSWNTKTENDLRLWRYNCFKEIIQINEIKYLVTWHNLTDRIESTFMNLLRWSGINWFISMRFLDQNNLLEWTKILRPLLSLSKWEIEWYCTQYDIPFVIDQTNLSKTTSLRNNIRLWIFPELSHLSNKETETSCSFFESMKQIYSDIENLEKEENIWVFTPIKKSQYRNADFAYLREIPFGFIDEKVILATLKKFNIYSDVWKTTLNDFLSFFKNSKQWYKYINWVYFFISNGKIYIIKAKQNFWEKYIEKEKIIDKLWLLEIWKETVNIIDENMIWKTIRYPKLWDKVWSKKRKEFCINKKIPIFWRNFIPVVEIWPWIVDGFTDVL